MQLHLTASEVEFQSELHYARLMRGCDLPEGAAGGVGINPLEIGVIEDVENFPPELKVGLLRGLEVLEQRQIPALDSRAADAADRSVARTRPVSGWIGKGNDIEPLICCVRCTAVRVADLVGTRRRRSGQVVYVGIRIKQSQTSG